ncbi:MAG TPA: CGNR zinc finger domain-containing protein [Solirubrobacteraceae bacterium]|nr:CGNR zinc finger domain-containing protein [Solirubrobacteraceae bacterium]
MPAPDLTPPNGLALVIDFVNTFDREEETDELADTRSATAWLEDRGLLPAGHAEIGARDRERAVSLREALRAMLLANNGAEPSAEAALELERTAGAGELGVHFDVGGASLVASAGGVPGALASLLAPVAHAMRDGTWVRVKACRADDCEWAFYDRSRNRSGVWCDMAVCGNREKVRTYRRRGPSGRR